MEPQNIPWDEISAQLKNDATAEQRKQIQEWLELSPENPVILAEIVNTWKLTRGKANFYQPDLSSNWQKLISRIDYQPKKSLVQKVYFQWAAAAAVLVLVFLGGLSLGDGSGKKTAEISYTKISAPEGNKTQIVLPDSTHVWLNSGSEIQYPSDYTAQNREVQMKGECYFDVVKDPAHPFLVKCSNFQVKVYGTQFNVNEDLVRNTSDVTLVSGKVEVLDLNNNPVSYLNPGQQFILSGGKGKVQKAENIEALTAWMNNMLIFDNQPFEEVIHYLEKWYGVKIQLDQSLYYSHNYTFKVKTESLREVLELISVITPIEYHIEGDEVTIKYQRK